MMMLALAVRSAVRPAGGARVLTAAAAAAAAAAESAPKMPEAGGESLRDHLRPAAVVSELDRYIVGQGDAKRAVAIALRNRWRRMQVPAPMRDELTPNNILMVGPTGCGKTEIARRLAKLTESPFVKVESTRFTEVGFVGKDVESIIVSLLQNAIGMAKSRLRRQLQSKLDQAVEDEILRTLAGPDKAGTTKGHDSLRRLLREGDLDDREIVIDQPQKPLADVPDPLMNSPQINTMFMRLDSMFQGSRKRKMTVAEARKVLEESELDKLVDKETLTNEAIKMTEEQGIVFLDEIDKICKSRSDPHWSTASSEGVQRDLLPLVEGSVVDTKSGPVKTDHILFIASGAFHSSKPSDLLAEFQGRFPVRVKLSGMGKEELRRVLVEPEFNLIAQTIALMDTEGVRLEFTEDAIDEIASVAFEQNTVQNLGARRLQTVLEMVVREISFSCGDGASSLVIDGDTVRERVKGGDAVKPGDYRRHIL